MQKAVVNKIKSMIYCWLLLDEEYYQTKHKA